MNYLNGGYAMIKHNASQKDLENAYKTNRPVLVYDENRRAHWAVIEETATESVDGETQEPITIYEYSYRLIEEASGSLYMHYITVEHSSDLIYFNLYTSSKTPFTLSTLKNHIRKMYVVACGYFDLNGVTYSATVIKATPSDDFAVYQNMYDSKTVVTFKTGVSIIDKVTQV